MKILVIGAGGHVGGILRPALEKEHQCRYLDLKPIPDAQCVVGDLMDPSIVKRAMEGMDGVIYLAMGHFNSHSADLNASFDVNVQGVYIALYAAGISGIRHFVYASSMSVYQDYRNVRDESSPADAWSVYGLTKALGEAVCRNAATAYPEMCIVAPRMIRPTNEKDRTEYKAGRFSSAVDSLGPEDTRRLFLAGIACNKPGCHILITAGDVEQTRHSCQKAIEIIGWRPQGN